MSLQMHNLFNDLSNAVSVRVVSYSVHDMHNMMHFYYKLIALYNYLVLMSRQ